MIAIKKYSSVADCRNGFLEDWKSLLSNCACPNYFYGPEMLLSAWECFGDYRVHILTAWENNRLIALLPVCTSYNFKLFPVIHTRAWRYQHCCSCMPLLAAGYESRALQAIFDYYHGFGRLFSIYNLPLTDPVASLITGVSGNDTNSLLDWEQRACLLPTRPGRLTIESQIKSKRLREYRRQIKLLQRLGKLSFNQHKSPEQAKHGLEAFMELERQGWKGRNETALISNEADRNFARQALTSLADSGHLHVYGLALDGRPLSMLLVLEWGFDLYTFKITHNSEYDRYSPGVLLFLESSKLWEQEARYTMVDSCAVSGHSMVDRIWYERRNIAKFHLAGGDPYTRGLVFLRKRAKYHAMTSEAA